MSDTEADWTIVMDEAEPEAVRLPEALPPAVPRRDPEPEPEPESEPESEPVPALEPASAHVESHATARAGMKPEGRQLRDEAHPSHKLGARHPSRQLQVLTGDPIVDIEEAELRAAIAESLGSVDATMSSGAKSSPADSRTVEQEQEPEPEPEPEQEPEPERPPQQQPTQPRSILRNPLPPGTVRAPPVFDVSAEAIEQFKLVTGIQDSYVARATLQKHCGDVDAAVTAALELEQAGDHDAAAPMRTEEEQMAAAVRASLEGLESSGSSESEQPPADESTRAPSALSGETGFSLETTLVAMGFERSDIRVVLGTVPGVSLEDAVGMLLKG